MTLSILEIYICIPPAPTQEGAHVAF